MAHPGAAVVAAADGDTSAIEVVDELAASVWTRPSSS
jgi:hypothetical protein